MGFLQSHHFCLNPFSLRIPETLKEWYEWALKINWQYRQEQAESKLLSHTHTTHKPHKMTGGNHEKAQAQASAWVQPMANTVTPHSSYTMALYSMY